MEYAKRVDHDNSVSVIFNIESDKIMEIADKMQEINEDAYMNGYNWEALLNFYLPKYHKDVTEGMGSDPEAGMYVAYYQGKNDLIIERANKLVGILNEIVEKEELLYEIVEKYGDQIEWD